VDGIENSLSDWSVTIPLFSAFFKLSNLCQQALHRKSLLGVVFWGWLLFNLISWIFSESSIFTQTMFLLPILSSLLHSQPHLYLSNNLFGHSIWKNYIIYFIFIFLNFRFEFRLDLNRINIVLYSILIKHILMLAIRLFSIVTINVVHRLENLIT